MNPLKGSDVGKKKLFKDMKIKGAATKVQQKKSQTQQMTISDKKPTQQQILTVPQEVKQTTQQKPISKLKQQPKKLQPQMNPKLQTSRPTNHQIPNYDDQQNFEIQNSTEKKQYKRTKSQQDVQDNQNQRDQDQVSIREDRSVVVALTSNDQNQHVQVKKNTKPIPATHKNNPFLNQIKKVVAPIKTKQQKQIKQVKQNKQVKQHKQMKQVKQHKQVKQVKARKQSNVQKVNALVANREKSQKQKQQVLQQLSNSHTKIIQSMCKKSLIKQSLVNLSSSINQFQSKIVSLTQTQSQFILSQQYQQADLIQNQLKELKLKLQQTTKQYQNVEKNFYQHQIDRTNIYGHYFQDAKRIVRRLKMVKLQIEDEITIFLRHTDQRIQQDQLNNQNQRKKITRIQTDIKSQTQQLQSYQTNFNEDLNARRKPLQQGLTEQINKKSTLQGQIKQLQQKLKKKKVSLKTTISSIQSIKQKISQVDETFQQQKLKLIQRKSHLSDLELQKNTLNTKLKQMQSNLKLLQKSKADETTKIEKQKSFIENIRQKLQKQTSSCDIQQKLQSKRVKISSFIHSTTCLKQFQQSHKHQKDLLSQLQQKKQLIQIQSQKNQCQIKQLKSLIPKLQNQQKIMLNSKNFKGAAMKKQQIKQTNQEIIRIKQIIQDSFGQQAQINQKIQQITKQQQQFVQEQNQLRKHMAISQYRLAVENKQQIMEELQWINSFGNTKIKTKYQQMLTNQLQTINQEINYIADQYQLKKDDNINKKGQKLEEQQNHQQQIDQQANNQQQDDIAQVQQPEYVPLTLDHNDEQTQQVNQDKPVEQVEKIETNKQNQEKHQQNQQQVDVQKIYKIDGKQDGDDDNGGYVPLQLD